VVAVFKALSILLVTAAPALCAELTPEEVLVVGNSADAESVELAKHYAGARGIPAERLLLVKTTTRYMVSRKAYEKDIRDPIRRFLLDGKLRDKIRCICLMRGVPVRVAGDSASVSANKARNTYFFELRKLRPRLYINYKLLATVGRGFPPPQTTGLKPVGKLFGSAKIIVPKSLPALKGLLRDARILMASKERDAAAITDAAKRRIAQRQLLALRLDMYGPEGLLEHLKESPSADAPAAEELQRQLADARAKLDKLPADVKEPGKIPARLEALAEMRGVAAAAELADERHNGIEKQETDASVDSELALLWWPDHLLNRWQVNPLHWRVKPRPGVGKIPPTLMAARIDGPKRADVMRMMKASLAVEKTGLEGVFYIDAGGMHPKYDAYLRNLYKFVRDNTKLKVVLDEKKTVFPAGSCPEAALYVGWYSLKKYVPAFMWTPGAVGYHIASYEAMNLRDVNSPQWCPQMIRNGVAATLGAVYEPYLGAFPRPDEFFPLLLTGKHTIAECYWRTMPMTSWRMTLIADPLYNPFKSNPQVTVDKLPDGLAP